MKEQAQNQRRLIGVALFLLLLFSFLIVQFFRLQIVQHEKWDKQALSQHTGVVMEPYKRGVFYANTDLKPGHPTKKVPLVIDVPKFHLFVDPQSIPAEYKEELAGLLETALGERGDREAILTHLQKKSRSRKLAMWLPLTAKEEIHQWWLPFAKERKIARNGVFFVKDYQRSYPYGKMLGQVLHTVRDVRDEKTHQSIPTGGLEYMLNDYLQGKPGKRLYYRSPRNAIEGGRIIEEPQNGADVYLTINHCLQAIVEEELEKQVKKTESKRGWGVMMDPYTGEVLALGQYPFFSPKECRHFYNDPEMEGETQVKAVTEPYEPGSTMKALTMAIGLMANQEQEKQGLPPVFDPKEKVGTLPTHFPGRKTPIKDVSRHKYMNMYIALQKSSNVYMAKVIDRVIETLGEKWYRDALTNVFGFGQKTGIELPAESSGLVPTPGKLHPNGTLEWSRPTPYSLAMGHNILVNTFQMLRSFAIFANGGFDVQPRLVKKIARELPDGEEEMLHEIKQVEQKRLVDPAIVEEIVKGMKFVTKFGGGARKADIYGFTEAGKTSTSEKIIDGKYSKTEHISTFIGFAPVEHPRFVLIVVMDEPAFKYVPGVGGNQYGGNCAAPAFRRIGLKTLEYLGVEPDDPFGYPKGDPRYDPDKADWKKEADALRELHKEWNK